MTSSTATVVVHGATGCTGRLVAVERAARGGSPVLEQEEVA